ncbi:MAG: helix-turn-helix transcriptional regulator [Blastocatellia bacterium]|nr:helix-turn-helix transcriptional regulator [Blastocatellia bacterium]MBN8722245.1 helix-turn-helix transcriptional regulator [Acidobacteriota bacterium]
METKLACNPNEHSKKKVPVIKSADFEKAAGLFFALGDAARLRLLERLLYQEWCVSELAEELGDEISTVSQRLKLLRTHGVISRRREGKHIYYQLSDQHIADLVINALAHASEPQSNLDEIE